MPTTYPRLSKATGLGIYQRPGQPPPTCVHDGRLDVVTQLAALELWGPHQGPRGDLGQVAGRELVHGGAAAVGAHEAQVGLQGRQGRGTRLGARAWARSWV